MTISEDHLKVFSKLYSMTGHKASTPIKIWELHLNLPELPLDSILDIIKHYVQKGFFSAGGDSILLTPSGIEYYEREILLATEKTYSYSIFISRIEENKRIADKLKELLETSFPQKVNVFVANSIPFSEDWLREILGGIDNSDLMIILCTPKSVDARWINFEAGAAKILGKNIGPICFGGQSVSDLPTPLNHLRSQGIDFSDAEASQEKFQKLIEWIAGKMNTPVPRIDLVKTEFYQIITTYSSSNLHDDFEEDRKKIAIDKLVNYYNRVNTDWNTYHPYHKDSLDRLERSSEDLWSIFNSFNDPETEIIKPKLFKALNILRYIIDSGRKGPTFHIIFQSEAKRRKEHDEFFSLLNDCITELKKPKTSDHDNIS
jgi:hypothetical protein